MSPSVLAHGGKVLPLSFSGVAMSGKACNNGLLDEGAGTSYSIFSALILIGTMKVLLTGHEDTGFDSPKCCFRWITTLPANFEERQIEGFSIRKELMEGTVLWDIWVRE